MPKGSTFRPAWMESLRVRRQLCPRGSKEVPKDKRVQHARCQTVDETDACREKKRDRNGFDLSSTLRQAEYAQVKKPPDPTHRFEVTLEEDSFTQEKFELFRHYQDHVHGEPATQTRPEGFRRFLCDSPLVRESENDATTGKTKLLGSYHQMYRLDGRLIAIGVLDLLPSCVSGVYFIYHADFEKYSFGKLSALREASMAIDNGYGYYYMGYYIHSCAKMRYKGDYQPQYFLDLDDFNWTPLDEHAMSLMEQQKYVSVSREERRGHDTDMAPGDVSLLDSAQAAESSGLSAVHLGMPGVMSEDEVQQQIDLDDISVQVGRDVLAKTRVSVEKHLQAATDNIRTSLFGIVEGSMTRRHLKASLLRWRHA